MKTSDVVLISGVGLIGIALAYWLLTKVGKPPARYALTIEATTGGSTEPPPGTYTYDVETTVTVTATPAEGYEFKGWYLNGELQTTNLTFSFTVTGQNLLVANFEKIGGPVLIPAYIRPVQNDKAEEWWYTYIETGGVLEHDDYIRIRHDFYNDGFIKFKIADQAGNGVPNQQIAVYTDQQPDATDFGYLLLNGALHDASNPLILTSNSEGVVSARITYKWDEPNSDYRNTIGWGGSAAWNCFFTWGDTYPIYDGAWQGYQCDWISFTRKKHPIFRTLNAVHAYWVDNPNLIVYGDCVADCMIKIEGDKKY